MQLRRIVPNYFHIIIINKRADLQIRTKLRVYNYNKQTDMQPTGNFTMPESPPPGYMSEDSELDSNTNISSPSTSISFGQLILIQFFFLFKCNYKYIKSVYQHIIWLVYLFNFLFNYKYIITVYQHIIWLVSFFLIFI